MPWKLRLNRSKPPTHRRNAEGLSDDAIRELLQQALFKVEERDIDWLYVNAFFTADNTVVYTIRQQEGLSEMWQREYTLDEANETVELGTERQRAERKITYEIVANKLQSLTFTYSQAAKRNNLLQQVARQLGITTLQGDTLSDVDLRESLWKSLQSTVIGFVGIEEVLPSESLVVYSTFIEETNVYATHWRTFNVADDDGDVVSVTLNDDEQQVQPVTRYEVVEPSSNRRNNCACDKRKENNMATNEKLKSAVDQLIASGRFQETAREWLSSLTEEALTKATDVFAAPKPDTPAPTPEPDAPATDTTTPTANKEISESKLAELVEARVLGKLKAADDEKRRDTLITVLSTNDTVKERLGDDLKALSLESLEKVASVLKVDTNQPTSPVDYSLRGMPAKPSVAKQRVATPDSWSLNKPATAAPTQQTN